MLIDMKVIYTFSFQLYIKHYRILCLEISFNSPSSFLLMLFLVFYFLVVEKGKTYYRTLQVKIEDSFINRRQLTRDSVFIHFEDI
jgi:hypothetical protein